MHRSAYRSNFWRTRSKTTRPRGGSSYPTRAASGCSRRYRAHTSSWPGALRYSPHGSASSRSVGRIYSCVLNSQKTATLPCCGINAPLYCCNRKLGSPSQRNTFPSLPRVWLRFASPYPSTFPCRSRTAVMPVCSSRVLLPIVLPSFPRTSVSLPIPSTYIGAQDLFTFSRTFLPFDCVYR
jgi:hypothetical protein